MRIFPCYAWAQGILQLAVFEIMRNDDNVFYNFREIMRNDDNVFTRERSSKGLLFTLLFLLG
jgi:hypothetical protein